MQTKYVVCVVTSKNGREVVMIRKNRPAWQAGRYNCPGGHVEDGETYAQAARREFREEAGVDIEEWRELAVWQLPNAIVHFFTATCDVRQCCTMTDETIAVFPVRNMPDDMMISNLIWLIPCAICEGSGADLPIQITEGMRWPDGQEAPER